MSEEIKVQTETHIDESDVATILRKMQQQLLFLERKIDMLVNKISEDSNKRSNESNNDRSKDHSEDRSFGKYSGKPLHDKKFKKSHRSSENSGYTPGRKRAGNDFSGGKKVEAGKKFYSPMTTGRPAPRGEFKGSKKPSSGFKKKYSK